MQPSGRTSQFAIFITCYLPDHLFSHRFDDECDDGDLAWHRAWRKEDGFWRGNPATAPLVMLAVREAEWLEEQRAAASANAEARASKPNAGSPSSPSSS